MRTTHKTVTFRHPFAISGLDGTQPPGDYEVVTDEEQISGLSFIAWRRVGTSLRLPALDIQSALQQWVSISPHDLADALRADSKLKD